MRVMHRVGTVDYSGSGECGEGRGSKVKGMGRQRGEGGEMRREWKKRAEI
jgi:hypothetical protein